MSVIYFLILWLYCLLFYSNFKFLEKIAGYLKYFAFIPEEC